MNDDTDISAVFNKNRKTNGNPLFTCGLKLDKNDYEKKVSHL